MALYSGNKPLALFVQKLPENIAAMNLVFSRIAALFTAANIENFEKLPPDVAERNKFAKLFNEFNGYLAAARVQGVSWEQSRHEWRDRETGKSRSIAVELNEHTYNTLVRRYRELSATAAEGGGGAEPLPYDLKGYITAINTDKIDADYMNSRFVKYIKISRQTTVTEEEKRQARDELHTSFASLSQEEQKAATLLLHEMQREDFVYEEGKTFREYISEYLFQKHDARIQVCATALGLDESLLRDILKLHVTPQTINEFGRFDKLKDTVDRRKPKSILKLCAEKKFLLTKSWGKWTAFSGSFFSKEGGTYPLTGNIR